MDKLTAHINDAVSGERQKREAEQARQREEVERLKSEIAELKQKA
ncbi:MULTISPECIES: hypothetical protein [Marinobacter]|uniref:Uncharacterized protein n=1 Tax=Marinobacter nauticus TaxID=2743 RepID=A0A368VDZ4_MARNT|nr:MULTISPECIES: hypothetical protein [Marinobacter]ERS89467.1 hypothetical protein Q667_01670 [Marinobacter sp. C1S70]RBP77048.1 hypothetical protein DET64_101233 [Marinobacter nauticus]RCW37894.1 hypothetical protein DET51_101232 [Marinobacter nauticus]